MTRPLDATVDESLAPERGGGARSIIELEVEHVGVEQCEGDYMRGGE